MVKKVKITLLFFSNNKTKQETHCKTWSTMQQQQKIVITLIFVSGEYSIRPVMSILDTSRVHNTGKTAQASG